MQNPNFSSGPCSKRPAWNIDVLKGAPVGRSHRSALGKERLIKAINETRNILKIPSDYLVGILPASDTGAFECAMWSLLGPKPVTVLVWESFSEGWATDVNKQLKLNPMIIKADYGKIPDLSKVDWKTDVVFVANGTTSGVRIPDWNWIPANREGLSLCDATSYAFANEIDWSKIDVLTFSWQKCLGGEAAHGMMILSPKAVARLESYTPPWPMPKIFRLKKGDKINKAIFDGDVINTPSMICVEDYLDALNWAAKIGLDGLFKRSRANLKVVEDWVAKTDWIEFLADDPKVRSNTSVCLSVTHPKVAALDADAKSKFLKSIASDLSKKNIAHDINSYKDAPAGYRFWCGPTIEEADIKNALAELEKVFNEKVKTL
ncbi:MAG TPA: phosphoserine transaminase [Smithellaceae bacterium]|nr:phosphoserine transaminase [Smithellaceae bacterium]HNV64466.1 phosphoserine transaminase [Smithellaceae bacterium]HNZ31643.1 phosphoserine transaminase [Smithellaceae bacterium]HOF78185.1 phosphoserine transaminase [Smithellaceae bacterium]HOS09424.1 phosphoserine transaminase [Smithellaceae bacterium]